MPKRSRCPHCDRLFNRDVLDEHITKCSARRGRAGLQHRSSPRKLLVVDGNNVAHFLSPEVRTLMDVGAETSTIVRISAKGGVEDSAFNERCAAGTGVYVDTMAKLMYMSTEEMAQASLSGVQRAEISSMCAVFAEQEVISHIHRDPPTPRNDVIKGIHGSIAIRVVGIAKSIGVKPEVMTSGGMAKNVGFVHEVEEEIKMKTLSPEEPLIVGALGAAILAG